MDHFSQICKNLNDFEVDYLIVGGTAVSFYGYVRPSTNLKNEESFKPDYDFWYDPTYRNYFKLLDFIESFGKDVSAFRNEKSPNPKKAFFKFELEHFTIDFIPSIRAELNFSKAFQKREIREFEKVTFPIISLEDLIQDKKAMGRKKDLLDVSVLMKLIEKK